MFAQFDKNFRLYLCVAKGAAENVNASCKYRKTPMSIMPNVLYNIGNTPLIRINNIVKCEGIECELCKDDYYMYGM